MDSQQKIDITNNAIESIQKWADNCITTDTTKLFHILELYESELKKLIIYDIIESEFDNTLSVCAKCSKVYSGQSCTCANEK